MKTRGKEEVQLHSFITPTLDETSQPGFFTPEGHIHSTY
jgi:hypothetical protein